MVRKIGLRLLGTDRPLLLALSALTILVAGSEIGAGAASSTTVVSAVVPSATNINTTGCPPESSATQFGTVLPGASATTPGPCIVTFGSSNDTAMLRLSQEDRHGVGMYQYSAGVADTSYGMNGLVTSPAIGEGHAVTYGAASAPDGKTLLLGTSVLGGNTVATVQRLNIDGTPDPTFGTGGIVSIVAGTSDHATWAEVQPDGRIVVIGTSNGFLLTFRLLEDGTLDTTYATAGIGRHATLGLWALTRVETLSTGTRIVVGRCWAPGWQVCLYALNPNGDIDTSWGVSGLRSSTDPTGNIDGPTLAVDSADRLYVAVNYQIGGIRRVFRITATGAIDTTFGAAGYLDTTYGTADGANGIGVQSTGKVVVSIGGGLARCDTSGTLDPTFGTAGIATPAGSLTPHALHILPDDSIVLVGGTVTGATFAKLRPDGSIDTTFGTGGSGAVAIGTGTTPALRTLTRGFDGSLLANTRVNVAGTGRFGAVRIQGVPVNDYAAGTTTWTQGTADSMFGACLQTTANATTTWIPNATCTAGDGAWWNPIVDSSGDIGSKVAQAANGVTNASVSLRFGLRVSNSQRPGDYEAPIRFDVVAPET